MKPDLHCDVCGCVIPEGNGYTCAGCKDKQPTIESLDRAVVLNAPYWRYMADEAEWLRTILDQGFEQAADGSIVWIEGRKQRERWHRENDVHVGGTQWE